MAGEKERVDGYIDTINRMEPNIHPVDNSAFYASAAISLKRMADAAEERFVCEAQQKLDEIRRVINDHRLTYMDCIETIRGIV